ncbi:PREDICTED: chondroadherin-like [Priapulus caudatus]|uniref:Chondroadherin-like n=1 Tax=Priapulus caudatus TaxID=37621 RepID=A0ABM1DR67_PRICU|nr:PREDICTED: chondroadherin-like [Priapulus caudatus]
MRRPLFPVTTLLLVVAVASAAACPDDCTCSFIASSRGTRGRPEMRVACKGLSSLPQAIDYPTETSTVVIRESRLTGIPTDAFKGVPYLTRVEIHNSSVAAVGAFAFRGLDRLSHLIIRNNAIQVLQSNSMGDIKGFRNKKIIIDLEHNAIQVIEGHAFNGTSFVSSLLLSNGNPIVTLRTDAFSGLQYVNLLELHLPHLLSIEPYAFRGLWNVTRLTLSGFSVAQLPAHAFSGLESVRTFVMSNVTVDAIESRAFEDVYGFTNLKIANASIGAIRTDAFHGARETMNFVITMSHIGLIETYAFHGMDDVYLYQIYNNDIDAIEQRAIVGVRFYTFFYNNRLDCGCGVYPLFEEHMIEANVPIVENNRCQEPKEIVDVDASGASSLRKSDRIGEIVNGPALILQCAPSTAPVRTVSGLLTALVVVGSMIVLI